MREPATAVERLENLFKSRRIEIPSDRFAPLTPDASTREYFRVGLKDRTSIACVYPQDEAGEAQFSACIDVTSLFLKANLPVAEILIADPERGIIVHEDFGDTILRDVLKNSSDRERERRLDEAIRLIARIQAATATAFSSDSIASRLSFDFEKLSWELDFFRTHYFGSLRGIAPGEVPDAFSSELDRVAEQLAGHARVLAHRDFHAANLMVQNGELKIIDHQDARIGSPSYDLVSLLLDRVTEAPPAEWLAEKRALLIAERSALGLVGLDEREFADEFRLQTIQRCLKAIGTFSFQSAHRGKKHFEQYIGPMFETVLRAARNIGEFPAIEAVIQDQL
jgi:aminoglycoside/choline kinase family phosphotransferase